MGAVREAFPIAAPLYFHAQFGGGPLHGPGYVVIGLPPVPGGLAAHQRRQINRVLLHTGWKKSAAARILRVSETMLNRKIRIYGLDLDG